MRFFRIRPKLTLRAMSGPIAVVGLLIWGGITASRLYRATAYYGAHAAKHDMYFKHEPREPENRRSRGDTFSERSRSSPQKITLKCLLISLNYWLKYNQRLALFEAELADYHLQLKHK